MRNIVKNLKSSAIFAILGAIRRAPNDCQMTVTRPVRQGTIFRQLPSTTALFQLTEAVSNLIFCHKILQSIL